MIIAVTAPRKGLGQTISAINLAALSSISDKKVLLIDTDKYCRDIEYFLSDTVTTKGLDEFISLYNAGILTEESFSTCVKRLKHGIDIMATNDCLELDEGIIDRLVKYSSKKYETTIFDTISGNNSYTRLFLKKSDLILVVLGQSKNTIEMVIQNNLYKEFGKKIVFVLNKHIESCEDKKVRYTLQDVEADLKNAGFDCPVFPLAYDVDILNECNDRSVLNIVFNRKASNFPYNRQLQELMKCMGGTTYETQPEVNGYRLSSSRRNKLFGLI